MAGNCETTSSRICGKVSVLYASSEGIARDLRVALLKHSPVGVVAERRLAILGIDLLRAVPGGVVLEAGHHVGDRGAIIAAQVLDDPLEPPGNVVVLSETRASRRERQRRKEKR